jgi:hypothetical protein
VTDVSLHIAALPVCLHQQYRLLSCSRDVTSTVEKGACTHI